MGLFKFDTAKGKGSGSTRLSYRELKEIQGDYVTDRDRVEKLPGFESAPELCRAGPPVG